MADAISNPDGIRPAEIPVIRQRIRAQLAGYAAGFQPQPMTDLPEWIRKVVDVVAYQIRTDYPNGIPAGEPQTLRTYFRRAVTLFDNEYAHHHFGLEPVDKEHP